MAMLDNLRLVRFINPSWFGFNIPFCVPEKIVEVSVIFLYISAVFSSISAFIFFFLPDKANYAIAINIEILLSSICFMWACIFGGYSYKKNLIQRKTCSHTIFLCCSILNGYSCFLYLDR